MDIGKKYPEVSFEHWLAMFLIHQDEWTDESIMNQISLYQQIEGDDEYFNLQEEIKKIINNHDLVHFLPFANERSNINLELADLEKMAKLILESK